MKLANEGLGRGGRRHRTRASRRSRGSRKLSRHCVGLLSQHRVSTLKECARGAQKTIPDFWRHVKKAQITKGLSYLKRRKALDAKSARHQISRCHCLSLEKKVADPPATIGFGLAKSYRYEKHDSYWGTRKLYRPDRKKSKRGKGVRKGKGFSRLERRSLKTS